jgi:hypothetical protein
MVFEREGAVGGAFVAATEEEKKIEVESEVPVIEEEEKEIVADDLKKEEEGKKEEEDESLIVKKDKKEEFKRILLVVGKNIKVGFEKLISFLSNVFSKFFNKISSVLQNKYGRKRWFKKLQSSTSVRKFVQGVKPFKIDGYKEKELRTRRFVTLFVILALVFAVFLGVRSAFLASQRAALTGELDILMEDWEGELDRAGRIALDDSEGSLALVREISNELDLFIEDLKNEGRFEKLGEKNLERIESLEKDISKTKDKANRIVALHEDDGNFELFLDTKLSFGEKSEPVNFVISKGSQIVSGEFLYVIDKGEKAVFEVSLIDGNFRKITDPTGVIKEPLHVDLGNNKEDEGLYVYDVQSGALRAGKDGEGKFNEFKNLSGLTARTLGGDGVSSFAVFGPNDSLNFLVPSDNRIIQAMGFGGTTYNLPSEYISHPSFEKGTDLFGDQYVYVLSTLPNGIKRFVPSTGLNSQLMVTGLEQDLQNITMGYTGATMDRALVVFDDDLKRFIQFSKPIEIGANLVHPGEIVMTSQYEYRGR